MTSLWAKKMRGIRIRHFRSEKHFPDSGKACVLKRKVVKMRFLPKSDLTMCGESEFLTYKIPRIQEKLYIDAKIRENNIFWSKKTLFLSQHIFTPKGIVFRQNSHFCDFSLQYTDPSLNQGIHDFRPLQL